jgi:hypothetical protein
MEGFSTPQSNKRAAGLLNPHPTGLQSPCSILLGSPPLGLHQATAPHQTHAWRDACLSGSAGSTLHQDNCPSATLASSPELDTHHMGIPSSWPCHRIHDHQDPCLPGCTRCQPGVSPTAHWDTCSPPPPPNTRQALLSPTYPWGDWISAPRTPHPSGPVGLQLHVE